MITKNRTTFMEKLKKMFEQPKKHCLLSHPSMSTPPVLSISETQFNYQYCQFTRDLPIANQVKDNLKYLHELYLRVCQAGGLVQSLASNKMASIMKQLAIKFPDVGNMTPENIFQHYVKFELFSFQVALKIGKRIQTERLSCLQIPKFIDQTNLVSLMSQKTTAIKTMNQDLIIIENFCQYFKIDQNSFSFTNINQKYGNERLKILVQQKNQKDDQANEKYLGFGQKKICENLQTCNLNLNLYSICQKNSEENKNNSSPHQQININEVDMKLDEFFSYFNYQNENKKYQFLKNKLQIKNDGTQKLFYAQSFDPKDDYFIQQIYQKLRQTIFCFKSNFDLLSYMDEDIPGVTFPNFQFMSTGNWFGTCQQPYGIIKIDINFGPDPTEWFCISVDHANKLWAVLKQEYGISFEKFQGCWIQQIQWFIEKSIPVKKMIQKKGDGVIVGSGSVYWKKSRGKSVHVSWNILPKTQKQIVASMNKLSKMKQLNSISLWNNKKIPIKTIFLRALNHQQQQNGPNSPQQSGLSGPSITLMRQSVKRWITQEQKFLNQMTVRQDITNCQFKSYYLYDGQSFCNFCHQQILNYFINNNGLSCLQCVYKCFTAKKINQLKDKHIYYKFDFFWLSQLAYYGANRINDQGNNFPQIKELCKGQFIGESIRNCNINTQFSHEERNFQVVDDKQKWLIDLEQFSKESNQNKLDKARIKILNHLLKNNDPKINKDFISEQSFSKSIQTQTNLKFINNNLTDQKIQTIIKSLCVLSDEKQKSNISCSPNQEREVSQYSINRKIKRVLLKNTPNNQKSETECSQQIFKQQNYSRSKQNPASRRDQLGNRGQYKYEKKKPGFDKKFRKDSQSDDFQCRRQIYNQKSIEAHENQRSKKSEKRNIQKNNRSHTVQRKKYGEY